MSKFITYEYESGEIVFIKRDSISSFHPVYTHPNKYRIFAVVGPKEYVIKDCDTIEDAKDYIYEQIAIIENLSVPTGMPTGMTSVPEASKKGSKDA